MQALKLFTLHSLFLFLGKRERKKKQICYLNLVEHAKPLE